MVADASETGLRAPPASNLSKAASAALALRITHPGAPALDTLDLVMRDVKPTERRREDIECCEVIIQGPPTRFGLLLAEALDTGMEVAEWRAFTGTTADPALVRACHEIWRTEVLPRFVARYASDAGDGEHAD